MYLKAQMRKVKKILTQAYFILQMNKAHLTHSKTMSFPMAHLYLNPEIVTMHFSLSMYRQGQKQ